MEKNNNFDQIFEEAMRTDPGYALPDYFVNGVGERIARKLALRLQIRMMLRFALILLLVVGGVLLSNYAITNFFPKYITYTINAGMVAVIALFVLFIFFMDRVVLGYLELRKTGH